MKKAFIVRLTPAERAALDSLVESRKYVSCADVIAAGIRALASRHRIAKPPAVARRGRRKS